MKPIVERLVQKKKLKRKPTLHDGPSDMKVEDAFLLDKDNTGDKDESDIRIQDDNLDERAQLINTVPSVVAPEIER